jgi:hypothetical protein
LNGSPSKGQGFLPGARLMAIKGATKIKVAVRTSLDREIGLMRDGNGNWRTIPKVDMVVVAVPAVGDSASVALWIRLLRRVVGFRDSSTGRRRPWLSRSCGTDGSGEMADESGRPLGKRQEGEANARCGLDHPCAKLDEP